MTNYSTLKMMMPSTELRGKYPWIWEQKRPSAFCSQLSCCWYSCSVWRMPTINRAISMIKKKGCPNYWLTELQHLQWQGMVPLKSKTKCNFQSQCARFGEFCLPEAPTQSRAPISAKNRGSIRLHPLKICPWLSTLLHARHNAPHKFSSHMITL